MTSDTNQEMEFHFIIRHEQTARMNGAVFVTLATHQLAAAALGPRWAHRLSYTLLTTGMFSAVMAPNTSRTPSDAMQSFREFRVRHANTPRLPIRTAASYLMWGFEIVGTMFGQVDLALGRVIDKILPEKL